MYFWRSQLPCSIIASQKVQGQNGTHPEIYFGNHSSCAKSGDQTNRRDTARQSRNQKKGNAIAELLSWRCEKPNHNQQPRFQRIYTKIQFLCHRSSLRI
jgi:hypothetical protein